MDGMSDLQSLSDSSESSGQSGSWSQSQASGMQVSSSWQWNSPMSHKMASWMAWGEGGEGRREREREKMQHEVMVANEVDSRQTGNVNLNMSECERVSALFTWWKTLMIVECCSVSLFSQSEHEAITFFFFSARLKSTKRGRRHTDAAQTLWFWQLPSSNKDVLSFAPWQTITKQFGKFVLIFSCRRGAVLSIDGGDWGSSVKAQSTKKSS